MRCLSFNTPLHLRTAPSKKFFWSETMGTELVHIGFGNIVAMNRIIAMASPNSAPTKRIIQEVRNKGLVIDMTNGRKTKVVIFTDSGHIILGALAPETIAGRLQLSKDTSEPGEEKDEPGK